MAHRSTTRSLVVAIALCACVPCHAVIVATGDGTENTSAPADDPGWANVGQRTTGLTVIYIGNGWVLTADHVGAGSVILDGQTYAEVAGSEHRLVNPDTSQADLLLFQIQGFPPLPSLPIRASSPAPGTPVTMIGAGLDRGAPTSWMGIDGFLWGSGSAMRWGTNLVLNNGLTVSLNGNVTTCFNTDFTGPSGGTAYEAQGAVGDSGGAVFYKGPQGGWGLAGVIVAIADYNGQPADTALYGDLTYAADLSSYRSQIEQIAFPGACGLGYELAGIVPILQWLRRRRTSRR